MLFSVPICLGVQFLNILKKIFLIGLFLFYAINIVIPQTIKWRNIQYTTESGLSNNEIYTIAQDSIGFM